MTPDSPQRAISVEAAEPVAGKAEVPIWLILLLAVLFCWGMFYVDKFGGWFNPEVFEPYTTYADVVGDQPYDPEAAFRALGDSTFNKSCALCHQASGLGQEGKFPPLAGSDWLLADGPNRIGRIVLNGLGGPIKVQAANGAVELNASMAPLGGYSNEELAAALSYARQQWGNKGSKITAEQIAAIRAAIQNHPGPFTADELLAIPAK
jgi:mono/diheme cytochrome c family protein